jgi:hypothetical protein
MDHLGQDTPDRFPKSSREDGWIEGEMLWPGQGAARWTLHLHVQEGFHPGGRRLRERARLIV